MKDPVSSHDVNILDEAWDRENLLFSETLVQAEFSILPHASCKVSSITREPCFHSRR